MENRISLEDHLLRVCGVELVSVGMLEVAEHGGRDTEGMIWQ